MSSSRLPGVYFETVVPPVPEPLPRLDIAAFVGFAPSGPLDIPVAIEDASRFQEIFGKDQPLAWDPVAGETVYAQLPPAVRAFFRNGGQRCWVVRVADNLGAKSNSFLIPGMLQASPDVAYQAGAMVARSEGSWSDELMVNATLSFEPLDTKSPQRTSEGIAIPLNSNSASIVSSGDLLQVSFGSVAGSPPSSEMPILFVAVEEVAKPGTKVDGKTLTSSTALAKVSHWFRPAALGDFSHPLSSPPMGDTDSTITWLAYPANVSWLTRPDNVDLWIGGWGIAAGAESLQFVIIGLRSQAEEITTGSWLRVRLNTGDLPAGARDLLLLVDSVRGSVATATGVPTSPATGETETVEIVTKVAWWALDNSAGWNYDLSSPRTDVVTLELWVRDGSGKITTLENLGLSPRHSFYLGYLPTDTQLYAQTDNPAPPPGSSLRAKVEHPRFPLAMSVGLTTATDLSTLPVFLPLGIPGLVDPDFYQPAAPQSSSALERDGLALPGGELVASLFLDPDLADSSLNTLLTEAFHKQYQLRGNGGSGPAGKPLQKLHAVLPLDEVSLLAVPDAMHLGWKKDSFDAQQAMKGPQLLGISPADSMGNISLTWTAVDSATSYSLQQSGDPRFESAITVWHGAGVRDNYSASIVHSDLFSQPTGCPNPVYFRVCAANGDSTGPWSNTLTQTLPSEAFLRCIPITLDPPEMNAATPSHGRILLDWSDADANLDAFELQIAYEPAFALPFTLYKGTDSHFEVWSSPTRTAYFRVGATRGAQLSPWSNTTAVDAVQTDLPYLMKTPSNSPNASDASQTEPLKKIHQAMIRLCAARGDVFTVLSVPRQFDAQLCATYKNSLVSALAPENGDTTLSFAGLYFPWLIARDTVDDQPGSVRSVSPEGTILGSVAALTIASGAWFAPGNQLLRGVVDLDPPTTDQAPYIFFDNQLNLVVQDSRGFLAMSSFTLSSSRRLEDINVRRLLILLRRLALREGVDYVFQPNDSSFWRIVQRRFEEVLGDLFLKGAFAGSTQAESFLVRTDSSVNPPESVEQGLFVVEMRIAPSLPLEFLTVRLLQSGGDLTLSEET
jgi:hypothetical protein